MRANTREGGRAEHLLRRILWKRGMRFRVHVRNLPGSPDLVFSRQQVCVFCDGDFWHGRNWSRLLGRLQLRANPAYWIPKIQRNIERDQEQSQLLQASGWAVIRLWETDILRDPDLAANTVVSKLTLSGVPDVNKRPKPLKNSAISWPALPGAL